MRILVVMIQEEGHLAPTFDLAAQIDRAGHSVTYLVSPHLLRFVRDNGFDGVSSMMQRHRTSAINSNDSHCFATYHSLDDALSSLSPDLLLLDQLLANTHAKLLRRLAVRVIYMNSSLPDEREGGLPPVTTHVLPNGTILNRLRIECEWVRVLAERWWSYARWEEGETIRPKLKYQRPEIVLCSMAFDFARPGRGLRGYVGPSIHLGRPHCDFPWHLIRSDARIIYCSFGTQSTRYKSLEDVILVLARAVATRDNEQLVVSVDQAVIDQLPPLPGNAVVVHRAPQHQLLQRASVVVTHGGLGTIKECIFFGVPMVVLPQAFDQAGNAARVEMHRLGLRCLSKKPRSRVLRELIDVVMHDPTIRENLAEMQRIFISEQTAQLGIEWVHRLCSVPLGNFDSEPAL